MRLAPLLLLLFAALVLAERRLSTLDVCLHSAYILAQGADLPRGRCFPPQRSYVDFRVDSSGAGTRLRDRMPACQRLMGVSVKVVNDSALFDAVAWIQAQCLGRDCVLYTEYALPDLNIATA